MTASQPRPEWNETERTYEGGLLHEAFAARASLDPDAPAVRFEDAALTYGQFDARVAGLSRHLKTLGVSTGMPVAVCMERSLEMVVSLHAIMRAGGAYVPIDPEYPDERIAFMLEDLDQPILLTQQRLLGRFDAAAARPVAVDVPPETMTTTTTTGATTPARIEPDDLAYVIYTSGSTGRPKGAMVSHGAIANRIHWMQEHFGLTSADRVLQKTPFSFDVSVWEFFWPLIVGAELIVARPGGHRDCTYLIETIVGHGVTTVHFVPSMLQIFLENPRAAECASLKRVVCSGEALPRALQDRFFSRLGAELHNLYGPTEAAVDVSAWTCDPQSELSFVPIGKPVANTQLHILDEAMQPVPVGTAGELHIGGVQVGQGYLGRPELTAERFLDDPFRPGGRLYKTGDLARYLPDGNIEFLGRADYQVKIRGFRVELGEIEAVLDSYRGVRGSVVVAHERIDGDIELVAYVAHPHGDGLRVDDLRRYLDQRLPEYMVPARYILLPRFPLTSSGKVDRKALPPPARVRPPLDVAYAAPRSSLELLIAEQWRALLDLDRIGIDDRFFELGGTSLQAARFVNQVQTELDIALAVTTLFDAPTIGEFAALLEREHPVAVSRRTGRSVAAGGIGPGAHSPRPEQQTSPPPRRGLAGQRRRRRASRMVDDA